MNIKRNKMNKKINIKYEKKEIQFINKKEYSIQ